MVDNINIDNLQKLCVDGKIKWTTHVLMRLQERGVQPSDVKSVIMQGEIIEQYPTDHPHPSCLVYGLDVSGKILHVVVGVGNGLIWLITAYYPDAEHWEADYKTRRRQK
jgi:hypothetical protein